jgi:CRISPR/Cas system CSM-associated protein Csm3 (group 7 of RAMP superfamily)
MPRGNRHFTYTLEFRAPLSIFTGLGIAGLVDRTVVRRAAGLPYVPGSTVKGRLRFFAERMLRSHAPDGLWCHGLGEPHCKDLQSACTVCRLFGNPAIPGLLRVGEATPLAPWDGLFRDLTIAKPNPVLRSDVEIRPGIALSRVRRTALPDHLFFDEAVPAVSFTGRFLLDARAKDAEAGLLVGVGRMVDALGARKSAGRGALRRGIEIRKEPA